MLNHPNKNKSTTKKRHQPSAFSNQAHLDSHLNLFSFYSCSDLAAESIEVYHNTITVYLQSNLSYGTCPYCGMINKKVHSHYTRTLNDLSILGKTVILYLYVRKFFCCNPSCNKKTFAEQPGSEIFRYRRRTRRCEMQVLHHGLLLSSSKAAKLLRCLGIEVSGSTILKDIHRVDIPSSPHVSEIGVDDWAFRKGITYGSIIVDLQTSNVIDLLGDRNQDSFKEWLNDHSDVELVSRDRSTEYSAAISSINKDIIEVADRFHLVKNMSECLSKTISENYQDYRELVRPAIIPLDTIDIIESQQENLSDQQPEKEDSRMIMFREVKELQKKGMKETRIAKTLGIARQTAKKYMNYQLLPERKSKARNQYYKYEDYVEIEHQKGKSLNLIFKEITEQGFKGSSTPFYEHYKYLSTRKEQPNIVKKTYVPENTELLLPIKQISHIVDKSIRDSDTLSSEENNLMGKLFSLEWFKIIYCATNSFYNLLKKHSTEALEEWIRTYENTIVAKLKTFVIGIKLDIEAVKNTIRLPVSNGIVEGFVNKLKMIKRTLFGKAKLPLLKRKMILPKSIFN